MNYLAYVIKESTQFCLRRMMIHNFFPCNKVEEVINSGLIHVDKWYNENGMKKNHSKYQAMVMVKYKKILNFAAKILLFQLLKRWSCSSFL